MTTPARPYSSQEDEIIRQHHGRYPASFTGDLLNRNVGSIRYRWQKLGLTAISPNMFKSRSNNHVNRNRPRQPSLPRFKFLADAPAITTMDLRMRAQDFLRWRREVHGI